MYALGEDVQIPSLDGEVWKPLPDAPGYYVSNFGRVYSAPRRYVRKGRIIEPKPDRSGLCSFVVRVDGKNRRFLVHRAVMRAFTGEPPPGYEVRHIDGNKANNMLHNLVYGPRKENFRYAKYIGVEMRHRRGMDHARAKLTPEAVKEIRSGGGRGHARRMAEKYGVSYYAAYSAMIGKTWRHVR